MSRPVLITGCHGLLGQKLLEVLGTDFGERHGVDIHPENWFNGLHGYRYHQIDLTNPGKTRERVLQLKPSVIINTAAMTNVDACEVERNRCRAINVQAVETLAELAGELDARLIHISTDYVFDGEAGPYTELDRPNPISCYGECKLESEKVVYRAGIDAVVLRTMVLFGHGRRLKPSFVAWLVTKLRERAPIKIVTDQYGNVTLVDDLAMAIRRCIEHEVTGLYHAAGREIVSRYEFALKVAEMYNLHTDTMKPTLTKLLGQTAPRPLQSGLLVDKAQQALGMQFRTVEQSLALFREQEATLN